MKNGILIVEFANQLRDEGKSIATAAGAVPLMIASAAAERQAIGVVIVFGVILATLITLFLISILYSRLAKWTGSPPKQ